MQPREEGACRSVRLKSTRDRLIAGLPREITSPWDCSCTRGMEHSTREVPRRVVETSREATSGSGRDQVPLLRQRCELVTQGTETVALLTQHATIDGSVELHDRAQGPQRTEQRGVVD